MLAESRLQTLDGAILIAAAARAAAHPERADHLPVDHDRDPARVSEKAKVAGLAANPARIVLALSIHDGGGLARPQRGLRLQQSGADVVVDLAVSSLHVHHFAGVIEDVHLHRTAL